ncbi:MAG: metal ABC transporter substrate-binding protein [Verrucomicrobiales bacterium]
MRPLSLLLLLCLLLNSCREKTGPEGGGKADGSEPGNVVVATCYPMQYFTERIAGEHLDVQCPLPDGADPIFWQPDVASIQQFQAADLIISNGAQYEKWISTVSLPESRVVDTSRSFEQDFIRYETSTTHRHGPEGDHTHTGLDGHTWLDPSNAKVQAATIRQALAKRWPDHAAEFEENLQALVADLDALDEAFEEVECTQALFASHPAYSYVAKRYGWDITTLELDPEVLPGKDSIPAGHSAKLILWESSPRDVVSALLEKQFGIKGVIFSTAGARGDEDYLATMHANIARLSAALE